MLEKNIFRDTSKRIYYLSLCVFLLFAAHYLQINGSGVGLQLPFNAMGWIPLSLLIGVCLIQIARTKKVYTSPLTTHLLICILLLCVPLFYFNSLYQNIFDRFFGLFGGLLIFLCFQQFAREQKDAINILLLLMVATWIEVLIGWDQFFKTNGMSLFGNSGQRSGPITGIFQQRNVYASFLAFGTVLSAYVLSLVAQKSGKKFQVSMLPILLLPLFSVHLLNTVYSRTGWAGLFIGVSLVLPELWKKAGKGLSLTWLVSLLLGFVLTWNISLTSDWQSPSMERLNLDGLRQVQLPQISTMFIEKPLSGYGYGRFESAYLAFTAQKYAAGEFEVPGTTPLDHPHNELLFWAVEGGIVALAALLLAAWFVWRRVWQQSLLQRMALIGLFFPIVLHTQLEFPFYVSVLHWFVFIALIFWVDNLQPDYKKRTVEATLIPWIAGILIPVLTTFFMGTTLHTGLLLARFESGINPDVSALTSISNPMVWDEKINWAMRSRLVVNGIINREPEQIQSYIDWAPAILESKPRPTFYRYLILAYDGVGDEENKQRIQQEARFLFPGESFEIEEFGNTLLRQVPFEVISRD